MAKVHPSKRIFYVPGLISLLGLTIVLWKVNAMQQKRANQRVMTLVWYNDNLLKEEYDFLVQHNIIPSTKLDSIDGLHPDRNFETICLNKNTNSNEIKLRYFQIRLQEIIAANDSLNGIKIHFDNTTTYNSLIKVINICKIENAQIYVPYEDDLWVWHEAPLGPMFVCGTDYSSYKPNLWEEVREQLPVIFSEFWHIITGLLILCTLMLVYIKQHFWKKL